MTAATVEATTLADELALETPTARNAAAYLSTITDPGVRRVEAARLVGARREELANLSALLAERFGRGPSLRVLEHDDALLLELTVLAIA